jgi:hypothetical protein
MTSDTIADVFLGQFKGSWIFELGKTGTSVWGKKVYYPFYIITGLLYATVRILSEELILLSTFDKGCG